MGQVFCHLHADHQVKWGSCPISQRLFQRHCSKISRNEGARVDHQCGWVDIIAIHAEHLGGAEVERGTQPGTDATTNVHDATWPQQRKNSTKHDARGLQTASRLAAEECLIVGLVDRWHQILFVLGL